LKATEGQKGGLKVQGKEKKEDSKERIENGL
jgi:hypothetical protein